jgi:hypothetical protein
MVIAPQVVVDVSGFVRYPNEAAPATPPTGSVNMMFSQTQV